jgi:hypothetical protein
MRKKTIKKVPSGEVYTFDVTPQTKIAWRENIKEEDKELLRSIIRDLWMAELRSVKAGDRAVTTFHVNSNQVMENLKIIEDLRLVFVPIRKAAQFYGFAHKFYDPEPNKPYTLYGAVAKKYEDAEKFRDAGSNHKIIGDLLGYPECCIDSFNKYWARGEIDPLYIAAMNTPGAKKKGKYELEIEGYPECNILLRYFGFRCVPNLVCNYQCEGSKEFAKMFLKHVKLRKELLEILSMDCEWSCLKGIAIVKHPYFVGISNSMTYVKEHKILYREKKA